jgi:hypothetical protein
MGFELSRKPLNQGKYAPHIVELPPRVACRKAVAAKSRIAWRGGGGNRAVGTGEAPALLDGPRTAVVQQGRQRIFE